MLFVFITFIFVTNNIIISDAEIQVDVKFYYETLCPLSRQIYTKNLVPVVRNLSDHITLKTNPYGFAKTFIDMHGKITFECQHGPSECYGNKIHACALKHLANWTVAVEFNGCMMETGQHANDNSVTECASRLSIDAEPIMICANGDEGNILLKNYGADVEHSHLQYIPTVLINGTVTDDPYGRHLYHTVCKAFTVKPVACK